MNLHIFSLCEHRAGAPSNDGQNTVRLEGAPPASADVTDDTPRPSQLGRFSDRRWGVSGDRGHRPHLLDQAARAYGGTADVVAEARKRGIPITIMWPEGAVRDEAA